MSRHDDFPYAGVDHLWVQGLKDMGNCCILGGILVGLAFAALVGAVFAFWKAFS